MSASARLLPDGRRLHLHHGPIDIVLEAFGPDAAEARARAVARFAGVLEALVAELPALRARARPGTTFAGTVARRMQTAVAPHRSVFVTPMAAVAGAVADELLAAMAGLDLSRAYVNNGGDVALHLAPRACLAVALAQAGARVEIAAESGVRGVATSGWRGRSQSRGIADAVTVLGATAAAADAAATLIANAVDLPDHPAIDRRPARVVKADSDLLDLPVTVGVGPLSAAETARALDAGADVAAGMAKRGLILGAALFLNGQRRIVGRVPVTGALVHA